MYRISFSCILFLLLVNLQSSGQANQAEFQLSAIGSIHNSATHSFKPLNEFGINYQPYLFPRTYLVLGLQGNTRNYNEDNTDSLNEYTGTLQYGQWMASVGVRHLFREEVVETFNCFAEASFHYTRLNTAGQYKGGQYGNAFYRYQRFKGVGLGFKAGTVYQRNSPWYYGANVALYFSGGIGGEISEYNVTPEPEPEVLKSDLVNNIPLTRFGIELRVGYRFYK